MMYKFKMYFAMIAIISLSNDKLFGQNLRRIYLQEYDYTLVTQGNCIDTFSVKISGNRKINIKLFSCKGQMDIQCYDEKFILIESGSYTNSLDLLKRYTNLVTFDQRYPNNHKITLGVYSYYQPLRNGTWYFYNGERKLYMRKNYKRGVLVDSVIVK